MPPDVALFADLHLDHQAAGAALFAACEADLFPCDALAMSVLERSLNLIKGFRAITESGGYSSAIGLLRMQLDNILRFNGVACTKDPHDIARQVISGVRLSKLKDRTGAAMTDKRLVQMLEARNPWVPKIYDLASGYIHLSREHFVSFYSGSQLNENGTRSFTIGDEETYISDDYRESLRSAFIAVSKGVAKAVGEWARVRSTFGTNTELRLKYARAV